MFTPPPPLHYEYHCPYEVSYAAKLLATQHEEKSIWAYRGQTRRVIEVEAMPQGGYEFVYYRGLKSKLMIELGTRGAVRLIGQLQPNDGGGTLIQMQARIAPGTRLTSLIMWSLFGGAIGIWFGLTFGPIIHSLLGLIVGLVIFFVGFVWGLYAIDWECARLAHFIRRTLNAT